MKCVFKYPISAALKSIEIPKHAKILCVQEQNNIPCIWALVDAEIQETESRIIEVYGTGHAMKEGPHEYIGTFQLHGGKLVFHVFERHEIFKRNPMPNFDKEPPCQ